MGLPGPAGVDGEKVHYGLRIMFPFAPFLTLFTLFTLSIILECSPPGTQR